MTAADTESESKTAFQVIIRPCGGKCNLACSYCYYQSGEQVQQKGTSSMTTDLLDTFTRQYIEAQQVPEVTFNWQGVEPLLMGPEFFQQVVNLQQKYRRPETTIYNIVQTNGLLLDNDWCRFFKANGFLIVIGIDGPGDCHDAVRVDNNGQPTLERVLASVELLHKYGVEFNTLTRVHAENADYPLEIYRFLRDQVKARFMQFSPVVIQEGAKITGFSVTAQQYGDFLKRVFNEWVRRDIETVSVDTITAALLAWGGQQPDLCTFQETCGKDLVLEQNGDVYNCDHFVEPGHYLGNINEKDLAELASSEQQLQFGLTKRDSLPARCCQCHVRFVCNGGCPKNRMLRTPDGEPGLNYLCEGYLDFFNYIGPAVKFIIDELEADRSPANVMHYIAQQDAMLQMMFAQTEPDSPCPCGSGLMYKDCHGRQEV
ncbi:MAG TPA: anaerobic sulfatase maturase [Dehalococcoidia bacterium]|nr:anaerobic sulfatase maturase [Dehalococcoidia bacterium]